MLLNTDRWNTGVDASGGVPGILTYDRSMFMTAANVYFSGIYAHI